MTKDEALRLALEALENAKELFISIQELGIRAGASAKDVRLGEQFIFDRAITAIKDALSGEAQTRSVIKDEPVAHSVVAGALFDFMGWLTSREKRLILSSVDEASPAVEAITEFAKKRNLSLKYAEVGYWMEFLSTPPPVADPHKRPSRSDIKPLTDEEIGAILEGVNAYGTRLYTFARAIEAAHGITGENT